MKLSDNQIAIILFSTMTLLFRMGFTEDKMYSALMVLARILGVN